MKERYFSPETINNKAQEFFQEYGLQRQSQAIPFVPARSALLVLDMQSFFLSEASHAYIPSGEAILPGLCGLVQAYALRGLPVFFTRHINTPGDAGTMDSWWRDLISAGDPFSEIVPDLDVPSGIVIQKSQYDAFHQTRLEQLLVSEAVSQVVIGGVMTHLCCETTARTAFTRGYEVFFLVDGTATYNEAFHRATLLNLSHGFAVLLLVKDVLARIGKAPHA